MKFNNHLKQLITVVLLLLFSNAFAQGVKVTGRVVDNETGEELIGATVQLIGERIFSTITNKSGDFTLFPLPPGFYNIKVSYIGFETYSLEYIDIIDNKSFGNIKLNVQKREISEVIVAGKTNLATVRGDTLVYNANNYKTNPDADAQDLVAKMPGIIVQDGTVQAQGENVKKVYVDGKAFFDQDPTLALKTLPADIIQSIQIFDESSEQTQFTGFDDGETSKVMNVVTRINMRNGQFGNVYAGYGYKNKYMAGGNISMFNGDRRISIIAQSNNVNQQNFSNEDLLGVLSSGGGGRRGGFQGGGGGRPGGGGGPGGGGPGGGGPSGGAGGPGGGGASAQDFMVGNQSGITTSHALGLNYSDKWGEKIDVSGSYFFNASDNEKIEDVHQTYLTDIDSLSQIYTEDSESKSMNYNHRMHLKLNYNINDRNRIILQPRLSFQNNYSESNNTGLSYINDSLVNTYINTYDNDRKGFTFSNQLTYMHKFLKQGRTISANTSQSVSANNGESTQFTEQIDAITNLRSDSLNQQNNNVTNKNAFSVRASYTEPIGSNSQLSLNAMASTSFNDNDKRVFNYDYALNSYAQPDTFLSNVYESKYNTQQLGGAYMYRFGNRNMLMLNLNYERASLSSNPILPANDGIEQTYHSVLPMLRFNMNFEENKRLDMFYRTNTTAPSVTQLQNTIDNSNPLQLSSGNPFLTPSYDHNLNFRYSVSNSSKGTVFFAMANMKYTQNYVGNNTWYAYNDTIIGDDVLLSQGGQFSKPENMDNYWSVNSFITYGFPISFIRSNFNMNAGYNYSYIPGVYNNQDIYSNNHNASFGLTISSNISENVDFTISSRTAYNSTNSSYLTTNNNYLTEKVESKLSFIFPYGITARASGAYQYYYWADSKEHEDFFMLNAEIGKKFGKNQQAELKLAVYDVLNQNQSYSRSVNDIYIEDVQTNVIQRYAMLTFTYRLRNFKM